MNIKRYIEKFGKDKKNIEKTWELLVLMKYLFSVYITILAFQTIRTSSYLVISLMELVVIIMISNWILSKNSILGHIVHCIFLLIYNVQTLVMCFGGSFLSLIMLNNIMFLHDLHGKFDLYMQKIIPMIIFTLIPAKKMVSKKKILNTAALVAVILEIVVIGIGGNSYSPFFNIYRLYREQKAHKEMIIAATELSVSAQDFYVPEIEDHVNKPRILAENPNVILIFAEGLSENIIDDNRNIMPNVQKFRDESLSFQNYYNHTFATLRGLIGQLYSGYQLENNDSNMLCSMQSIFKQKGYQTAFINTEPTNIDFTNYLENFQFDELVTNMDLVDPSAEYIHDKDAFDILYDTVKRQSEMGKPFFTSIYTFGTHVSLESPDERYGDGNNALLNRFYNLDYQFACFLEKFKNSELIDDTILIFTTDHATYEDDDFLKTFPEYQRHCMELDKIPLYIYHNNIIAEKIDVDGRNSLDLAPTVMDYLDISLPNYFLGRSLFAPKQEEFSYDTVFYEPSYILKSDHAKIEVLTDEQTSEFRELLINYSSAKGDENIGKVNDDDISVTVSDDFRTMTILLKTESDYKNVWFPVWSDENGNGDLVFYKAVKNTDGNWEYVVDLAQHNSKGVFLIHVYEGNSEPEKFITATQVYVADYPK